MSKKKMLILSLFLAGCFLAAASSADAAAKTRLAVGGNGIGGVYYLYSGAISQIINQAVPGAQATVEVVPGSSVEHVKRMQINDMQLGPAMNDVVFQAVRGTDRFKEPQANVRTLFIMYPAVLQGVTLKKLQIRTPGDLVGKRVSIGNPGTGSSVMTQAVLEALAIDPKKINLSYLNWNEGANAIRNGILDVQFAAIGLPAPFIMDLSATHETHLVGFSDAELAKIQQKFAYYPPSVIPKGVYGPVKEDIKVPGIWNSYLATRELSDDLAYRITKAVYENMALLKKAYKDADQATPENTMKFSIAPLHPGAIQYYKEKGMAIPDRLMPK